MQPCKFEVTFTTPFFAGGPSRTVDGGTEYEFKIKQAVITPRTEALARQLNAAPAGTCGRQGGRRWAANASQDVTPTGGCQGMGLRIPLLEHDLVRPGNFEWPSDVFHSKEYTLHTG